MIITEPMAAAVQRSRHGDLWRMLPHEFAARASGGEWTAARHLEYTSRVIARAVMAGHGRVVVNMPSGYGKSGLISRWTPAWFLSLFPNRRVILCANTAALAVDHGGEVRNIARDNPLVRFRLRTDTKAKGLWHTQDGGGMMCKGVGGSITGWRAHLLLIDDPYTDWDDAWSPARRGAIERWFDSTAYQRLEPDATVVVLHHRFHARDLSGYLTEHHPDKWTHVRLPEIAEGSDPLGRAPGEVLWPERWPHEKIAHFQKLPGPIRQAMRQQNPGAAAAGVAYSHYGSANNAPVVLDSNLPLCISFDFNINPGMYCLIGQYDQKADQFRACDELHGYRWSVDDLMDEFVRWFARNGGGHWFPEFQIYGDSSGGGTNMTDGRRSYEVIRQHLQKITKRIKLCVPGRAPGVINSLHTCNDALRDTDGVQHVQINAGKCPILVKDLLHVQLDNEGQIDKSDGSLTHASDCLRYWVNYLRPIGGRRPQARGAIAAGTQVWA